MSANLHEPCGYELPPFRVFIVMIFLVIWGVNGLLIYTEGLKFFLGLPINIHILDIFIHVILFIGFFFKDKIRFTRGR